MIALLDSKPSVEEFQNLMRRTKQGVEAYSKMMLRRH